MDTLVYAVVFVILGQTLQGAPIMQYDSSKIVTVQECLVEAYKTNTDSSNKFEVCVPKSDISTPTPPPVEGKPSEPAPAA